MINITCCLCCQNGNARVKKYSLCIETAIKGLQELTHLLNMSSIGKIAFKCLLERGLSHCAVPVTSSEAS